MHATTAPLARIVNTGLEHHHLADLITATLDDRTLVFASREETVAVPATDLVEDASRSADHFRSAGIDAVGAVLDNSRPAVTLTLACLLSGTRLMSLPPPHRGQDLASYLTFLPETTAAHGIAALAVPDLYAPAAASFGLPVTSTSDMLAGKHLARPAKIAAMPPSVANADLIQFTSGTTSTAKGIR